MKLDRQLTAPLLEFMNTYESKPEVWSTVIHGIKDRSTGEKMVAHAVFYSETMKLDAINQLTWKSGNKFDSLQEYLDVLHANGFPFETIAEINNVIKEYYGLPAHYHNDDNLGFFIGVTGDGHVVHSHTDPRPTGGGRHVRFNCILQSPEQGGHPVMRNKEYPVEQDQVWVCEACQYPHKTSVNVGPVPRLMFSSGFDVTTEELENIRGIVKRDNGPLVPAPCRA